MEDVRVKLNPGLPWTSCVQQEEDSLYQQTGLKFEEETSKMTLYDAETWTLPEEDQKCLECFEMWC